MKRIGVLHEWLPSQTAPRAAIDALATRGWIEGRNLFFERRAARAESDFPVMARQLVALPVNLLLTFGTPATRAAKNATSTIPVLFSLASDPVANGIVPSLAKPGGNVTGTYFGLYPEKLLEKLNEALPGARHVAYLEEAPSPSTSKMADRLRVDLRVVKLSRDDDFRAFFQRIRKEKPDGIIVPNINWLTIHMEALGRGITDAGIPSIAPWPEFARHGGLLAYGPTMEGMEKRRLDQIDALLRGASAADMPVEMPTRFRLVINVTSARKIGVVVPPTLLVQAAPEDVIRE